MFFGRNDAKAKTPVLWPGREAALAWASLAPLAQTHRGRPQTTSTRLYAGGELQGSPVWSSNESTLRMRWPKYWSFSFSIIPSKEHLGLISFRMDWLISLQSKGLVRVFSNTTVQKHKFFGRTGVPDEWSAHPPAPGPATMLSAGVPSQDEWAPLMSWRRRLGDP